MNNKNVYFSIHEYEPSKYGIFVLNNFGIQMLDENIESIHSAKSSLEELISEIDSQCELVSYEDLEKMSQEQKTKNNETQVNKTSAQKRNSQKPKNFYSEDEIKSARNISLADYFMRNGYVTKKHGNELYIENIPGLCVNVQTNSWYHHYNSVGGNNPIDCLTKVLNKDFMTAVGELTGKSPIGNYNSFSTFQENGNTKKEKEIKKLKMPEKGENYRKVYAYLIKSRGISKELIDELIHQRLLYQDIKGNAVFVHKNENGEVTGAEVQGTNTNVRYKGIAEGTADSVFKFFIGVPKKAYIFESTIDLCSFYVLSDKTKLENSMLVSMAGCKPIPIKELEANGLKIISCVDNDERGKSFNQSGSFKSLNDILEKNGVKDWNELLQKIENGGNFLNNESQQNSVEHFSDGSGNNENLEKSQNIENIENNKTSKSPQETKSTERKKSKIHH